MAGTQSISALKKLAIEFACGVDSASKGTGSILHGTSFMISGLGGLSLSDTEDQRYREILQLLYRDFGQLHGRDPLKRVVQEVILRTVGHPDDRKSLSVEKRAEHAIGAATELLSMPPQVWRVGIPLTGLVSSDEPLEIGRATIAGVQSEIAKESFEKINWITSQTTNTEAEKESTKRSFRENFIDYYADQSCLFLEVSAVTSDAAWDTARRQSRYLIDCLNFIIGAIHSNRRPSYGLSDMEARRRHYTSAFILNVTDYESSHFNSEVSDTLGPLALPELRKSIEAEPWMSNALKWLSTERPSKHQQRVLAAMQWAGRAALELRPEEAFLHLAICLESLIIGSKEHGEITNRLALCATHLSSTWLISRKRAVADVKKLYGIRSKIVHSGAYEISDSDLRLLQHIVYMCFIRLLSDEGFLNMKGDSDLDEWFNACLRGGD